MKKCKLYSTAKGIEVEAIIVDNKVLVPIQIDAETRYVPPAKAVAFARDESVWLLPFSVQCKWGEFGECTKYYLYNNYDESAPRPGWAIDREIDDIPEKWGYCDARTGEIEIPPQWEYCEDFNEGYARIKGGGIGILMDNDNILIEPCYSNIVLIQDNGEPVMLVKSESGLWGAYCYPDWDDFPAVQIDWDGIWYDGGAYTVKKDDEYLLLNAHNNTPLIDGLTQKPERYDCGRQNSCRDHYDGHDYRIINREGRFGLVKDWEGGESSIILAPEYDYEDVLETAYQKELEDEISYYAIVISRTASGLAYADCWEFVPEDIRNEVWRQAKNRKEEGE